jgi:hypothetical protein
MPISISSFRVMALFPALLELRVDNPSSLEGAMSPPERTVARHAEMNRIFPQNLLFALTLPVIERSH